MDERRQICEELRRDSNALAVLLLDEAWRELARAGAATLIDAAALALLRQNAAALHSEREIGGRFDPANRRSFHLSSVGAATLVILFDERTSLGLVRLRAKKATERLSRVVTGQPD
jgi:hypothetical protein